MKRVIFLFVILLGIGFTDNLHAQIDLCREGSRPGHGRVTYANDVMLDTLINRRIQRNMLPVTMQGFRIQIYFGSSREEALSTRSTFLRQYPEEDAYLSYDQPYFRIRIGNFRTRAEAQPMYQELRGRFESVIIVPETVTIQRKE